MVEIGGFTFGSDDAIGAYASILIYDRVLNEGVFSDPDTGPVDAEIIFHGFGGLEVVIAEEDGALDVAA